MARNTHKVMSFRADWAGYERILRFATDNDLVKANGEPNVSLALNILIGTGFQDYQGQLLAINAFKQARASVLTDVKPVLNQALQMISDYLQPK